MERKNGREQMKKKNKRNIKETKQKLNSRKEQEKKKSDQGINFEEGSDEKTRRKG